MPRIAKFQVSPSSNFTYQTYSQGSLLDSGCGETRSRPKLLRSLPSRARSARKATATELLPSCWKGFARGSPELRGWAGLPLRPHKQTLRKIASGGKIGHSLAPLTSQLLCLYHISRNARCMEEMRRPLGPLSSTFGFLHDSHEHFHALVLLHEV